MEHLSLMQVKGWHTLGGLLFSRKAYSLLGKRLKMNAKRGIDEKNPKPNQKNPQMSPHSA